jgi:pimeloyl-ACP methyl ester carboxylesterase
VPAQPNGALERVPLPWFLKKRIMNAFLRDVHHYLFDVEYSPSGGTPVRIQQTIRQRFVDAVCNKAVTRPHIVVSHSMGTVIAYDCLKRVGACANVDGLITIGSPLGLDEIQDKLRPEWSRANGFPREKVAKQWINIFDRLDPVCGFDPSLANDYRESDAGVIKDIAVVNDGAWRHSATKYLRQPAFRESLRGMLEL